MRAPKEQRRLREVLAKAREWIWRQPDGDWRHHEPDTSNALLREIDRVLAEEDSH